MSSMNIFSKIFKRGKDWCDDDLVKPYRRKVWEALRSGDLPRAVAYLESAIKVAPKTLDLYLKRAQILQYGMANCTGALRDYRFVLRELELRPSEPLAQKCRQGMKDMMAVEDHS